jgi:TM2 domain-containing membrane protein YozV
MKFLIALLVLTFFLGNGAVANNDAIVVIENVETDSVKANALHPDFKPFKENKKLMAMALNFSLGMLGAHRLYLGTKPHVPVFYLLTFGGVFFVIPIIDFFVLTFSKDITPYINNDKILMWVK